MIDAPWYSENKDKKFSFYAVLIKELPIDEDSWDIDIIEKLSGYTDNQWVFNRYMNFYHQYFDKCSYITFEYNDLTYDEFIERVNTNFKVKFTTSEYIFVDNIWITDETIYLSSSLGEIDVDNPDCVESTFIPAILQAYHLINKTNYLKGESFDIVKKLLFRLTNIYVPLVILTSFYPMDFEDYENKDMLIYLTKIADFSNSIDEYEYYDIISSAYIYKYFIVEYLNYNGD